MDLEKMFHMVGGQGETSYATNSRLQEKAILKSKPLMKESISTLCINLKPETFTVADLGCSSGPTTFLVMSEIISSVADTYKNLYHSSPEILYFLNDLPRNDFNSLFRCLNSRTQDNINRENRRNVVPCYVAGVPGSFYGRLFPERSVHFVHSSYSLHWLSQVPEGLKDNKGSPINCRNIFVAKTSPNCVLESYGKQFKKDFSKFLEFRSKEIIFEGQMVLTFQGRNNLHPQNGEIYVLWGLLADALNSMVAEGLIEEARVNTFDLPFYPPSLEEVREVVKNQGCFDICKMESFETNWDPYDDSNIEYNFIQDYDASGLNVAKCVRAVLEPTLVKHFGDATNIDPLFSRFARNVSNHLIKDKTKYTNFILVLRRRII